MRKLGMKSLITSYFFIIAFLVCAPLSNTLSVQKAKAQIPVTDVANLQINILDYQLNLYDSANLQALVQKEVGGVAGGVAWDLSLGWLIVNELIRQVITSMTDWIRTGFHGKPAFVTDLDGFLLGAADLAAGEYFLLDGPLEFICEPFDFKLQEVLRLQYYSRGAYYEPTCKISDAIDNVDAFISGDFTSGGWDGWASVTLTPSNNIYGSVFEAQAEMSASIGNARGRESMYLDFGRGFFGVEQCNEEGKECQRITPGATVENALNNTLDIQNKRLSIADEMNEMIGAFIAYLVDSVLSSDGGLAEYDASSREEETIPIEEAGREVYEDLISEPPNTSNPIVDDILNDSLEFAEERALCQEEPDMKWDLRCNMCVSEEMYPGDACNWDEQPRSFDCDTVAGDSCTDTCDELGGTYDSLEDSCVFTNVEVRDSIRYCDPADTYDSLMTPEECLDSCTYSMETKYDFGGFIIPPQTKREKFSEDPEYWRQWCWATYRVDAG